MKTVALLMENELLRGNNGELRAENARLKAALRVMRAKVYTAAKAFGNDDEIATAACSVADAALSGKGET